MGDNAAVIAARKNVKPPDASTRLPYMPGLDGLRAIAVISVLLYHAEFGWAIGGFLGVEVFFVISGYLITSLLLSEWRDRDAIDLKHFWSRRARRLLPALFALVAVTTLVAVIFLPDEVASLRGDVLSALAYVTNWNFIFAQKSYFEAIGRPSMVQHLWSLAVEEQFYLLWPLMFVGGMKVFGRKRFPIVVVGGAVVSAVLMWVLYVPDGDPSRVYYGTDTRASGLLFGCALAFVWAPWRLRSQISASARRVLNVVGVVALVLLVQMLLQTNEFSSSLYRGGFLRLDVVAVVVIAVLVHPAASLGWIVGMRPLRWVGLRSYGIYLWHWPVYQLTRPGLDVSITGAPLFALRLALTLALAEASYRLVELPVRQGALGRWWDAYRDATDARRRELRNRWIAVGMASVLVVGGLAVFVGRAQQPPPPDLVAIGDVTGLRSELPPPTVSSTTSTTAMAMSPGLILGGGPIAPTTAPSTTTTEAPRPTVPAGRTVTALGDSVMLGAMRALQQLGPSVTVDAAVNRQVNVGIEVLTYYRDQGLLGDTVVIHLGNNGTLTTEQFDEIMTLLEGHRVVFLTVKVPGRRWEDPNNAVIVEGVSRYGNAALIDWKGLSEGQPELFYDDQMHLRPDGALFYSALIAEAV
jgi:peptidoglycan/LPS O-acetylase OafA/YrhL